MANTYPGQYIDVSMFGTSSNKALEARISALETLFKTTFDQQEITWGLLQKRLENDKL